MWDGSFYFDSKENMVYKVIRRSKVFNGAMFIRYEDGDPGIKRLEAISNDEFLGSSFEDAIEKSPMYTAGINAAEGV